jgi:hypothetical protein
MVSIADGPIEGSGQENPSIKKGTSQIGGIAVVDFFSVDVGTWKRGADEGRAGQLGCD